MKKNYIAPQLFEIVVQAGCILAGSGEITQQGDNNAVVTPGSGEYTGSDWASRRGGVWDDEI